jgi:hypothetical protein
MKMLSCWRQAHAAMVVTKSGVQRIKINWIVSTWATMGALTIRVKKKWRGSLEKQLG